MIITLDRSIRRKRRVSLNIRGTGERPRVSIFRSNHYTYAQAIDDEKRQTLAAFSSLQLVNKDKKKVGKKSEVAKQVGIKLAEQLKAKKIAQAVFDRGSYKYHGRVQSVAEGLREGGIQV